MVKDKKIVFIIGASSGIGLATAKKLSSMGHTVYCGARTACPDPNIKSFILDVANRATVTDAIQKIYEENGRIDWFVYSAGFSMAAPIEHAKETDYRYLYEVNFFGAMASLQAILPIMREKNYGRIALIGSMGGIIPIAYDAFYSSSKSALEMLSKNLNLEVKSYNIRCTAVLPGGTVTRFTYKRKVYPEKKVGIYADDLHNAVISLADTELSGMSPESVANSIIRNLNKTNPPTFVSCGMINKMFFLAKKFFPDRLIQSIVAKKFKLHIG